MQSHFNYSEYTILLCHSIDRKKKGGWEVTLLCSSCPGDHQYHRSLATNTNANLIFLIHNMKAGVRRKFTSLMFNLVQAEATEAEEPLLQCSCLAGSQLHIARTRQQLQPSLQLPSEGNLYLVLHQHTASLYLH